MSDVYVHADRLASAVSHPTALENAYADWITAVLASPLWSTEHRDTLRIPWRSFATADASAELQESFRSQGLYLWGSAAGVPLYLGSASARPLRARLLARYVGGADNQCPLAAKYESELVMRGMDGLPTDYWERWHRRAPGGAMTIPRGAVAFARHGIDGIWFTLLPFSRLDSANLRALERQLIRVANAWNRQHGYESLLNVRDKV